MANNPFQGTRRLGRSGLVVGPIGLASSYGGSARAFQQAFEHGCNYFYWGSMRREGMGEAIRNLAPRHREDMVVVLQSYSRIPAMLKLSVRSGLKRLKLDRADVLLLGWYNKPPGERLMETVLRLREAQIIRKIAISCHDRPTFEKYIKDPRFDIIMVRYNAAHRGAEREVFPHLDQSSARPGVVSYTNTRWGFLVNPKYTPAGLKTPTAADCYRFALTNPHVDLALTGPSNDEELAENLKALELGPLSEDELKWMRAVGDHVHKVTGRSLNPFAQRRQ